VASDVATQQRAGHAERVTGAARVLEVDPVDRGRLLDAVRRTDPDGRYAMAVVVAPGSPSQPPRLAVDSARLERVAAWRTEYGEVGQLADRLRPPAPEPLRVRDGPLAVELSVPAAVPPASVTLSMTLVTRTGERPVVRFGPLPPGREVHRGRVSGCPDGCRLAQLSVSVAEAGPAAVTWHGLEQHGQDMVPEGWRTGQWREAANPDAERISLDHTTGGVTLSVPQARPGVFYRALPPDSPYPLPVVTVGELDQPYVVNVDNQPVPVSPVARLAGLPRLGGAGVLMDLEYAERSATAPGAAGSPEVWLAAAAPADVADRLAARGLTVSGERTVAGLRELLDSSGPAVALRYHLLAAGTAALVGLMALVQVAITDRGGWIVSLRRLRVQGVPRHTVTASVLWSYGGLVILGTVLGVLAAAAGWLATGDRLPLGVESLAPVRPQWRAVLAPWLAAVALLAAGGAATAAWQNNAVTGRAVP
jgi:putative ABC transport system permease protein